MTKKILLSQQGKNKGKFVALVDDEDFERISQYRWCIARMYPGTLHTLIYAVRSDRKTKKTIYMHREVLGLRDDDDIVDHINGDGLNNTKGNLRMPGNSENLKNSFRHRNKELFTNINRKNAIHF